MKYLPTDIERIKHRLSPPPGKIKLVIDSDAGNEVDDQFAIAWALCSPKRFDIEAVYAAPFSFACIDRFNATLHTTLNTNCLGIMASSQLTHYNPCVSAFNEYWTSPPFAKCTFVT